MFSTDKTASRGILDVYVAPLPCFEAELDSLASEERRRELEGMRGISLKEKIFVWRLLEHAVLESLGEPLSRFSPHKNENGKWVAEGVFFSLSHSSGALAVAVSNGAVGVDIEREVPPRAQNFAKEALNDKELSEYLSLDESSCGKRLIELWSMKESVFKMNGGKIFHPRGTDSSKASVRTVRVGRESFVLSLASKISLEPRIILCELEK